MYNFKYNNIGASTKGVAAISRPNLPAPEPMIETIEVKGRDGALHINYDSYKEIAITINCNFSVSSEAEFASKWREIKNWLKTKYGAKLETSDDANCYYKVNYVTLSECKRKDVLIGSFDATFYCDPYIYYASGDRFIKKSSGQTITNAYDNCCPLYRFNWATSGYTASIGGKELKAAGPISEALTIDTELLIAYDDDFNTVPIEGNIEDWRIPAGETVEYVGTIQVFIYPHWRSL